MIGEIFVSCVLLVLVMRKPRRKDKPAEPIEFQIDLIIQRVLYKQILIWMAFWYSPFTVVVSTITMIIGFIRDLVGYNLRQIQDATRYLLYKAFSTIYQPF